MAKKKRYKISKLSPMDVSVLSVLAQKSSLPEDVLSDALTNVRLSADARKVAKALITSRAPRTKVSGYGRVALGFRKWATQLKRAR